MGFQRSLGAGVFGGEGFILQHLSGTCQAWVELGGEIVTYDLEPGEVIQAHPGHVGMFEDRVNFDIGMVPGIKNALFGGEGFFLARLTGPGKIWLQTMTPPMMAHSLAPYLGHGSERGLAPTSPTAIAGDVGGAVLRDIFGSNR